MEPAILQGRSSDCSADAAARDRSVPATRPPEDDALVPPYWQVQVDDAALARASLPSRLSFIRLEDHTEDGSEHSKALWAKHVTVDDYVIVAGAPAGVGAYVVWNITVETLNGGPMRLRKRYSEFDRLRRDLVRTFPHAEASIPQLPRKSVISRFQTKFLDRRKAGLSYFLNCVLLNPEFSGSPVLKDFLFS